MSARELRQLNADNETWLRRPENRGQAIIQHGRRWSPLRRLEGPSTRDGLQRGSNAVTDRRGRRARDPPQQRGQDERRERSRSPLRPAPAEPSTSTGESSRDGGRPLPVPAEPSTSSGVSSSDGGRPLPAPAEPSISSGVSSSDGGRPLSPSHTPIELQEEAVVVTPPPPTLVEPPAPNLPLRGSHTPIQLQEEVGVVTPPPVEPPAPNLPVRRRRRRTRVSSREQQIARIPTRVITPQEEAQSCAICLADCEVGERLTVLPCNHSFHQGCVGTWLRSNPMCPLCRHQCFW